MSDEKYDDDDGPWVDDIPGEPVEQEENVDEGPDDLERIEAESTTAFPEKWKQKFEGIAYIGYLEEEVSIPFHKFVVRTLLCGEKIEVTQIAGALEWKIGYNRAYKAAVVAAGLVSADGEKILIAERERGAVRQKYEYVVNVWHDTVIDILYHKINKLEGEVVEIMEQMGFFEGMKDGK